MSDVKYLPLRELAEPKGLVGGPFGSNLGSKDYTDLGVPVIRGQNLGSDHLFNASEFVYVSEEKARTELSRNLALPGDVVFTQRGTLGQVGIVPESPFPAYVVSQSQMRLRVNPAKADAKFIYYCFRNPVMLDLIRARAITTGVPHINLGILSDLPIVDRPLSEQKAVSALLGSLDDKITINRKVAETSLALALGSYGVASGDQSWISVPLGGTARWLSGGTPHTSEPLYWDGSIPWISALSLRTPWIDDSERRVTELGSRSGTRLVPADTIIFVVRGSSLDTEFRIGLTQREVAFGQDCKALIPLETIDPALLFIAIKARSTEILNLVDHAGHGAGRLSTDLITKVGIRLPKPGWKSNVVEIIRSLASTAATKHRETQALVLLRNAILPTLISGELRIKDAERLVSNSI